MTRMTSDIEVLQQLLQDGLVQFAIQGLTMVFVTAVLLSYNWKLALITVVMVMRMEARQVARPRLVARARDVSARRVELARVAFALVLACGDGFGSRAVVLSVAGLALRHRERRNDHQADSHRNTHRSQHGVPLCEREARYSWTNHRDAERFRPPAVSDEPTTGDDRPAPVRTLRRLVDDDYARYRGCAAAEGVGAKRQRLR